MLHLKCGSCAVITAFRNLWKWLNHTAAHCAHGTLLLLCFTGNKAVIYGGISPQRYEVWWSLSMTEWLEFGFGWPQEGEKKKSNCCGFSASPKLLCAFTLTDGRKRSPYLVIFGDYLSPLLVKFHRCILLGIRRWRDNKRGEGRREERRWLGVEHKQVQQQQLRIKVCWILIYTLLLF